MFEPQTASAISPECLSTWTQAATSGNQADPFCCSPAWQLSFHEAIRPARRLFVASSPGSVLALAEESTTSEQPILAPLESSWMFGCPLLGRDALELLAATLDTLGSLYAQPPLLLISGIRPKRALARRLLYTFGSTLNFFLHSQGLQCAASLEGGVDGFLSRRSANHRHKLKKAARRAAEQGISFERVLPSSPAEAEATYARMIAVELTSWKGIGQCGMAEAPVKLFYDVLLHRLAASQLARVIFARHADKDIGFIFGGLAGSTYRGQQFSYHADWKDASLGNLMQLAQITWLCEEGVKRYDMGPLDGPRMEYKQHWTEQSFEIQTWLLEKK